MEMKKSNIVLIIIVFIVIVLYKGIEIRDVNDYSCFQWGLKNNGRFYVTREILENNNNVYQYNETNKNTINNLFFNSSSIVSIKNSNIESNSLFSVEGVDISYNRAKKLYEGIKDKKDVIVAVIDTGIYYEHDDLKNSFWINENEIKNNQIDDDNNGYIDDYYGYDFYNDDNSVYDNKNEDIHGTHAAGTIIASYNKKGITGIVDNENIKIMILKILGERQRGQTASLIKAIKYAEKMGADICNISLGTANYNSELENIIKNSNMLFVAASGNGMKTMGYNIDINKIYPASFDFENIITVSNLSFDGNKYASSNYGSSVDIYAPGTFILSTLPENQYGFLTGTSVAAPFVSGVAAMLKSSYGMDSVKIKKIIIDSAKNIINNDFENIKLLDAYNAMKLARKEIND